MGYINDENDFMHTKYSQSAKPAIGFKQLGADFDMDNKKIFRLKTQSDVAIDADYDSYALDLSSGVNKGYLKLNCLTKDVAGNDFDANQATINNSAPYYDGLYQKTSLVSKEYVDLMDTNLEQKIDSKIQNKADLSINNEQTFNSIINVPNFDQGYSNMSNVMNKEYIDSRDALKADKTYADNTFLTKKTGAILANTLQSKASKIYADSTFLTKVVGNGLAQNIQNRLNIHGSNMMQANLDMGGYNITHLKDPSNDTDAVNKKYMLDYVGESHVQSANGENKFKYIMDDPNAQVSQEDDVELGNVVTFQNSPHKVNKKVVDMKLLLDNSKGYYSSRIGLNLYLLTNDQYTAVLEIMWVSDDIDPDSLEIYGTSSIETIHNVSRKTFKTQKYIRALFYYRFLSDYASYVRGTLFGPLILPLRYLIFYMVQRQARRDLWSHGIGRHSEQDVYGIAERDLLAVSAILDQKKFLFGEKPCLADVAVFAYIAASWDCPQSFVAELTKSKAKNLEKHAQRMKEMYFPDWNDIIPRRKHKSD
ncbi:hypothetical protein ACROYT_G030702 [Oculina patagonica]